MSALKILSASCALAIVGMAQARPPAPVIPVVAAPVKEIVVQVSPPMPGVTSRQVPALTVIRLEILSPLDSSINKIGDYFPIRLASPIDLGDGLSVPTGTLGKGAVVHAAKSRFGGKAGELLLAARYLEFGGTRIPLRSLTFLPGKGKDQTGLATGIAIAGGAVGGVASLFITGGEVRIPSGAEAFAKTAIPVIVTPPPAHSMLVASTTTMIEQEGASQP